MDHALGVMAFVGLFTILLGFFGDFWVHRRELKQAQAEAAENARTSVQ